MKALKELYAYFIYFRRKLGAGIYLLMLFYFAGSYFNGFGISLLLPLLSVGSGGFQGEQFESLARFFAFIGAAPSFTNLLILFSVVFLAKGIFQFLQDWYRVSLATQFAANLQKNLAEDYSRLNFHYYSKTKSGFFTNIFTNEANNVVSGLYGYINAFGAGLNSVVLFAFARTINPYVTVAALVGGGVIFGLSTPLRDRLTQLSKGISQANGSLVHHFIQFIVGFKYLKSIEGYFRYVDRIENELQEARALQFRHALNKAFVNAVYEPATVIFLCAVIYLQVVKGGHTVTEIAVPLLLLNRFLTSFFAFQRYWHDFSGAIGSIHTLESAMESMAKNREHTNGRGVGELRRGIELKNLSFRYDDRQILNKINLFIPKNKCVAIVGESGAGKTTLLNVLSGLLPAHEAGSVLYDDLPYSELDKLELRAKFGYITQEAVLFDTTVIF